MKIKVRCSYELEMEVPDEWQENGHVFFAIEENSCPATGSPGHELYKLIDNDDGICWACNRNGECKILEINGKKVTLSDEEIKWLKVEHMKEISAGACRGGGTDIPTS